MLTLTKSRPLIYRAYSIGVDYPVGRSMLGAYKRTEETWNTILDNGLLRGCNDFSIFVRGSSGAILGTLLAAKLMEAYHVANIFYVRKDSETHHSGGCGYIRETAPKDEFVIIIDDFICSGETIVAIIDEITACGIETIDMLIVGNGGAFAENEMIKTILTDGKK